MNDQFFSLQPFPSPSTAANQTDLEIIGTVARQPYQLILRYSVLGDLSQVAIESATATPERQNELWQDTCFELFLGVPKASPYWEFNLSPSGHWNVYRFDEYRKGRQEEKAIATLPFNVEVEADALSLELDLDLAPFASAVSTDSPIEVGITTVLKHTNGEVTYWALTHPGKEPDFHQRKSFQIKL